MVTDRRRVPLPLALCSSYCSNYFELTISSIIGKIVGCSTTALTQAPCEAKQHRHLLLAFTRLDNSFQAGRAILQSTGLNNENKVLGRIGIV